MSIKIVTTCVCLSFSFAVASAHADDDQAAHLFEKSEQCIACHSNIAAADGSDVSIGYAWRASMMANSARDPYWHAGVRREVMDHPAAQSAIEDKCSTCHMPMDRFAAAQAAGQGRVFDVLAAPDENTFALDGVSCTVCHQITDENFGAEESFTGGFRINDRNIYGPHDVAVGHQALMRSATDMQPETSLHLRESELCATCHTLYTHALDEAGNEVGELAEQVPFLEWQHSDYATTQSCQDCHMPELADETPISSVLGEPRPQFSQHVFRGGNAFMLGILRRHRDELGVPALPQELDATIRRTREYLETSTARVTIDGLERRGSTVGFAVAIASLAGHKLPTAYPSRRVWLHVIVRDAQGRALFESGAVRPNGSIVGNANDMDGARYEPHYDVVSNADQVQIYEPILVDFNGTVTTGLLYGVRYIKDNRLLPRGFDKTTASDDVGVFGAAANDDNFVAGGDSVRYELDLGAASGELTVEVELLFQSIGYRWAENLKAYRSAETDRFVRYYEQSANVSAMRLATATATF